MFSKAEIHHLAAQAEAAGVSASHIEGWVQAATDCYDDSLWKAVRDCLFHPHEYE